MSGSFPGIAIRDPAPAWRPSRGCAHDRQPARSPGRAEQAPTQLDFTATAPKQVWLAHLTCIRTGEGWRSRGLRGPAGATVPAHLAALIDMFPRKVVGWAARGTLHADIALKALAMAVERQRASPGLIHHSDRAVQYAADDDRKALAAARMTPSMSRKGNCLDNAPTESFFHRLKVERSHRRVRAALDEARRDLFACNEGFYTPRRLHSGMDDRSPAAMERMAP